MNYEVSTTITTVKTGDLTYHFNLLAGYCAAHVRGARGREKCGVA